MGSSRQAPPPQVAWPLLPLPDEHGRLRWPTLGESVRDSLQLILLVRPGEYWMHPLFGGGLHAFVGESNTVATRRAIHDRIVEALEAWEPRIQVDRVDVEEDAVSPTTVQVEIVYRLRRTGASQRLAVSLELSA